MGSIEINLAEHLDRCQGALEDDGCLVFAGDSDLIDYAKGTLEMIDATDKDEVEEQAVKWFQVFKDDAAVIEYAVEELGLIDNSDKKTVTIKLNTTQEGRVSIIPHRGILICKCGGVIEARTDDKGVTTTRCRLCHDRRDIWDVINKVMKE